MYLAPSINNLLAICTWTGERRNTKWWSSYFVSSVGNYDKCMFVVSSKGDRILIILYHRWFRVLDLCLYIVLRSKIHVFLYWSKVCTTYIQAHKLIQVNYCTSPLQMQLQDLTPTYCFPAVKKCPNMNKTASVQGHYSHTVFISKLI